MRTFSRLWTDQVWTQYLENKPNFVDYSLQIMKIHILKVLAHTVLTNKQGFE